jgi:hypothetical protein
MRHILEAGGVKDVVGKSLGSANAINTAWATLKALQELRSPETVARLRGVEESEFVWPRNGGNGAGSTASEAEPPAGAETAAAPEAAEASDAD